MVKQARGGVGGDRDRRDGRPGHGRGPTERAPEPESEFTEEVVHINRVAKVVKGGRKFHFTALVALGDKENRVGLGYGKASEVVDAIKKGVDEARKNMITVCKNGTTIPYEVREQYCSSTILMRPAAKGHGIIAGGAARPILALAGYEDVTAKFVGSNNAVNTARATFNALKKIQTPDYIKRMRRGEKVDRLGRYGVETKRSLAEEAIAQFTAEEEAAKRETEERLSRTHETKQVSAPVDPYTGESMPGPGQTGPVGE
jgi:small subunit ribosomal protein S5